MAKQVTFKMFNLVKPEKIEFINKCLFIDVRFYSLLTYG